jgi:hypothetical protein
MFKILQTVEKAELEIRQIKDQHKTELDEANKKCHEYETKSEVILCIHIRVFMVLLSNQHVFLCGAKIMIVACL